MSTLERPGTSVANEPSSYRPPSLDQIDPTFIHLSSAVMQRSDFEPLTDYNEPVEPKVLDAFDYQAQAEATRHSAEDFAERMATRLSPQRSTYDRIFEVLRAKYFRASTVSQTRFDENRQGFRPIVEAHLAEGSPLEFVLPSFPFKHNNPVKVRRRSPDMAEMLCLSRLYEVCHVIGTIYEPGARFVVISDGQVYRRMFGVTNYEATAYRERSRAMIAQLGWADTLSMVDMADLVASHQDEFDLIYAKLRPVFAAWWHKSSDNMRRTSLIKASATNINTADSVTNDLVQMVTRDATLAPEPEESLEKLDKIKARTLRRAEKGAFEFALFLYVLREMDLVGQAFPGAVRSTVHPKPGQWGLHLVNQDTQVFPWQGVAYLNRQSQWRVKYEFDAMRRRAVPVHLRGDDEMFPFYYQETEEPRRR